MILKVIIIFFTFTQISFSCPYQPEDLEVQSLGNQVKSIHQSLRDSREYCGSLFSSFSGSFDNVELYLNDLTDKSVELSVQRSALLDEVARLLLAGDTEGAEQINDQILLIDKEIDLIEKSNIENRGNESIEELGRLTSSLLETLSQAKSNPECAGYLEQNGKPEILKLGLLFLQNSDPLLYSAGVVGVRGAVGIVSSLMGKLVDNFTTNLEESFEDDLIISKGEEMACLYHNVVAKSCELESTYNNSKTENFDRATKYLRDEYLRLPNCNREFYESYTFVLPEVSSIQQVLNAISQLDATIIGSNAAIDQDTNLSEFEKDIMRKQNTLSNLARDINASEQDRAFQKLEELKFLHYALVENKDKSNQISGDLRQELTYKLQNEMLYDFKSNSGRISNQEFNESTPVQLLDKYYEDMLSYYKSNIERTNRSGALANARDALDIFGNVSLDESIFQARELRSLFERSKGFLNEKLKDPRNNPVRDIKRLQVSLDDSIELVDEYIKWLETDMTKSDDSVLNSTSSLYDYLNKMNPTTSPIEEIGRRLRNPLTQLNQILSFRKPNREKSPFKREKTSQPMSEFERFNLLYDSITNLNSLNVQLTDISHMNQKREIVEKGLIFDSIEQAIKRLIDGKGDDLNPLATQERIKRLCALSASRLSKKTSRSFSRKKIRFEHPIEECERYLDKNLKQRILSSATRSEMGCSFNSWYKDGMRDNKIFDNREKFPNMSIR